MIVYIEANFILELAYMQEQHESCEEIVSYAESGDIRLVLPAFSVAECYENCLRKSHERNELHGKLSQELAELSRSKPYSAILKDSEGVARILVQSEEEVTRRLDRAMSRVLSVAVQAPIDQDIVREAIEFRNTRDLRTKDSIVYASVLAHLRTAPDEDKCFLNKDKDFANSDIRDDLNRFRCKVLRSFVAGHGYIKNRLEGSA